MTPQDALRAAGQHHGLVLLDGGPCPGGEIGARYAQGARGETYVYKCLDQHSLDWATEMVGRVERLRANGYPASRYLAPLELDGSVVLLQEKAEGGWSDLVDDRCLERVLSISDRQAGLGTPGTGWSDFIASTLTEGADGYCLHDTLFDYGGEAKTILEWVRAVGHEGTVLPQNDLVHFDFHHRNILQADGADFTIIDLEGCQPGDRAFDLVAFSLWLDNAQAPRFAEQAVWEKAANITEPAHLRAYVAHMVLRRVDWTIRLHPTEVEQSLSVSRRFIDRVEAAS